MGTPLSSQCGTPHVLLLRGLTRRGVGQWSGTPSGRIRLQKDSQHSLGAACSRFWFIAGEGHTPPSARARGAPGRAREGANRPLPAGVVGSAGTLAAT